MSASDPTSAIFMNDSKKDVQKKINKYAFSGGRATVEEHRELGGNPDVDVPYQYLTYFLEDDAELERIHKAYKSGEMLTGEMKQICIKLMQEYVEGYQERRKKVTEDVLKSYMTPRKLQWGGNKNVVKPAAAGSAAEPKSSTTAAPAQQTSSQPSTQQLPLQSLTQLPPSDTPQPAPAEPMSILTGEPASTEGTHSINSPEALEAEKVEERERQKPAEQPERPGLATLKRGKSYGVRGLSMYAERMSAMLYGDDIDGTEPSSKE